MHNTDVEWMSQALALAASRRGFCAPNPAVGAVVIKDGVVLGEGCHWACGQPHAEVQALQSLGKAAAGATLYVTLEPCSHQGRTPPCTDLIIQSGLRELVYAVSDPNPQVAGKGALVLERAGVLCRQLNDPAAERFYDSYRYWLQHQRPWVTAKLAMSLDGKIAGLQGEPIQLTGPECQRFTHEKRLQSDAILTTAKTVIADNPQFNVRLDDEIIAKPLYLLDSQLRLPLTARIFQTSESITVFYDASQDKDRLTALLDLGVDCVAISSNQNGLDLTAVLNHIGQSGKHDLWIEAGGHCFESFLQQHLLQRAFIYVAPKIIGRRALNAFTTWFDFNQNHYSIKWHVAGKDCIVDIVAHSSCRY